MRKQSKKTIISLLLAASCILSSGLSVFSEDLSERPLKDKYVQAEPNNQLSDIEDTVYYAEALAEYQKKAKDYTGQTLTFGVESIKNSAKPIESSLKEIGEPAQLSLIWNEDIEWIEWEIDVPETALYNVAFTYHSYGETFLEPAREFYLDGKIPYTDLSSIGFRLGWQEQSEPVINNINDEVVPTEIENKKWHTEPVCDSEGYYSEPLRVYLEQGKHVIMLKYITQPVALSAVSLQAPKTYQSYAEVLEEYRQKNYKNATQPIEFQAETNVSDKNSAMLHRVPNDDPCTQPYEAGYVRLNAMGDLYWQEGGQKIEWSFEVQEAGLYRIDMRVGNWFNQDLPVSRKIEIDGKVPFREFLNYSFPYSNDWTYHTIHTDSGDPYLFYFEPGTHTIAMTVILGKYADIIMSLYEDTDALTGLLLDITLITGNNPDVNYEYNLERNIKDIKPRIKSIIDSIDRKVVVLRELSGGKEVASINTLLQARQNLQEYYDDPEIIPKKLNDMSNMQDNFTTWYASFQSQPLIIDYFVVNVPDAPARKVTSNFWKKFVATFRNFMTSFVKDYDSIGKLSDVDGKTILDVWVSMGAESADILKNLADSDFTPDSNIAVNISILPAGQMNAGAVNSLQLAIISGKAPDVALGVGAGTPVELGIRGAVADVSKMEGFEEVKKNYVAECFNANTFNDGVYGIPERMDFRVLIYRTDIFQTLGLSVPDTWEDVIDKTLPALAQNQMEMFIPQDYTMFLYQNNGEYYSADGLSTKLDSPEAYQAFKQYVEMYTDYGIPVTTQFFNRFRVGTIPIGVGNINEYFSLLYGAPEILGKWEIALLPGVKQADGSVKRSFGSTVTSSSVILSGDKEEASWEFMKWWTSVEIQSRFAQSVEARINVASRVNTANKEAFKSLPWVTKDLKVIVASWDHIKETKGVLGGYYMARHLNNAWARLVVEKQSISVRDSLEQAIDGITKEMQSYQSEYPNLVRAAGE